MKKSLIEFVNPVSGSTILIYDVHACSSGALSILNDLYSQIRVYPDKSVKWVFTVSSPEYDETDNIIIMRYPWVKKSWLHRYYFNKITTRAILKAIKPNKVFSLQNEGINFYSGEQIVYLHLAFILTDYKFHIRQDGKVLWFYQNVIRRLIFKSLHLVGLVIVQTQWMKSALISKAGINPDRIMVLSPDVSSNTIYKFVDSTENRRVFFYPATAFAYKNHETLLKAFNYAIQKGLADYSLSLTIEREENGYTRKLAQYVDVHNLKVKFVGSVSRDEVFRLYSHSVLVFPSYVESFGLPLLEAKLAGCYILASDTPFCREILSDYDKVDFFNATDFAELGEKILKLQNEV